MKKKLWKEKIDVISLVAINYYITNSGAIIIRVSLIIFREFFAQFFFIKIHYYGNRIALINISLFNLLIHSLP